MKKFFTFIVAILAVLSVNADEVSLWQGSAVCDNWNNQPSVLSVGGTELKAQNAQAGDTVVFHFSPTSTWWSVTICNGSWSSYSWGNPGCADFDPNKSKNLDDGTYVSKMSLTHEVLDSALNSNKGWGTFILNGNGAVCTQVGFIKKSYKENSYAVSGDLENLFGTNGDYTSNEMDNIDGIWTWNKYNVTIPLGDINYSIAEQKEYENYTSIYDSQLSISENGKYNVTVKYDPATNYGAMYAVPVSVYDTWTIVGDKNIVNGDTEWNEAETLNDLSTDDGNYYVTYMFDKELEAGHTYYYKYVRNHDSSNGVINNDGLNIPLTVAITGKYKISFKMYANYGTYDVSYIKTGETDAFNTYTVMGNSTDLFGATKWNAASTENNMIASSDGTYTFTKIFTALKAGNISYRVSVNHDASVSYGDNGGDAILTIDNDGYYNVTFTFNHDTKEVSAEVYAFPELKGTLLWTGDIMTTTWGITSGYNFSEDGSELINAGTEVGDQIWFYTVPKNTDSWILQIMEGHWKKTYGDYYSTTVTDGVCKVDVTQEMLDNLSNYAASPLNWGGSFVLNGDSEIHCYAISLVKAADIITSISDVNTNQAAGVHKAIVDGKLIIENNGKTYNSAGQLLK